MSAFAEHLGILSGLTSGNIISITVLGVGVCYKSHFVSYRVSDTSINGMVRLYNKRET